MELDRQAIERRDFPISRRGYDPAAVDAHLRALAAELEELQRRYAEGGDAPLASSASSQVQGIIAAAERAAAEIEREAAQRAQQVREAADRDAERARGEAIERSRAHVAAVSRASEALLERVGSIDGELRSLIDALRSGGARLRDDLAAVDRGMGELYDAAAGGGAAAVEHPSPPQVESGADSGTVPDPIAPTPAPDGSAATGATTMPAEGDAEPAPAGRATPQAASGSPPEQAASRAAPQQDLDGARLVALNMALNGSSRAETERFLAENYQLADGASLVEEVFAAIET